MIDILIIGNGPAGLSAALYGLRAGLSVYVIGKDNGSLSKADKIDNYFGITGSPTGNELIAAGKKQVIGLGGKIIEDEVLNISWDEFFITTAKNAVYYSRSVILATGSARKSAKIPGIKEFEGKGVSYCAVCDAFFYRNKDVAVLGNGVYALHEANELLHIAKSVTVLTNGFERKAGFPKNIRIIYEAIAKLEGTDNLLSSVQFTDGTELAVKGLFIALGSATAADLAKKIGAETERDKIVVNDNMETSVPGLFAAGDCTGGILQLSVAVGEGAKAALSAINFVRKS